MREMRDWIEYTPKFIPPPSGIRIDDWKTEHEECIKRFRYWKRIEEDRIFFKRTPKRGYHRVRNFIGYFNKSLGGNNA